ncbi:hypothetical protein OUZ56_029050 [Daphnia magna]|uniref:Uncharacterized protein n=1 Tax=Daphnia magna TaxID=35525 RepID=A0ABR0B5P9_9CRUS|nr:hypothetical protein OUZ56_029050 [Daphnia magna]
MDLRATGRNVVVVRCVYAICLFSDLFPFRNCAPRNRGTDTAPPTAKRLVSSPEKMKTEFCLAKKKEIKEINTKIPYTECIYLMVDVAFGERE